MTCGCSKQDAIPNRNLSSIWRVAGARPTRAGARRRRLRKKPSEIGIEPLAAAAVEEEERESGFVDL